MIKVVFPLKKREIILPFESEKFISIWSEWKEYKKTEFNFKYKSPQSEQASLSELANLSSSEDEAIEIIFQSMSKGWKGFFEIKKKKNESSKNNSENEIEGLKAILRSNG